MMRKMMATLGVAFCALAVSASPSNYQDLVLSKDSSLLANSLKNKKSPFADTLFDLSRYEAPRKASIGGGYAERLFSIQKDVPLPLNQHVESYIQVLSRRRDHFSKMLGLSKFYFPVFEQALVRMGIPEEIKYLSVVESALDPHAVSKVGATGLWQFMFATGKGYHLQIDNLVDERKDPIASSEAAAAYLRDAYNKFGDWLLAIAAYNCGSGSVSKAIAKAGGVRDFWAIRPFLPKETQNYVPAFIATTYVMNYAQEYGIYEAAIDLPHNVDVIEIDKPVFLSNVSRALNLPMYVLLRLNPSYKKQLINGSVEDPKKLVLPALQPSEYDQLYAVINDPFIVNSSLEQAKILADELSEFAYHTVRSGETLSIIGNRFGFTKEQLMKWNDLSSDNVSAGQVLKMAQNELTEMALVRKLSPDKVSSAPASKGKTYEVRAGDSLTSIAEKFNESVSSLKNLNGLSSSSIQPGQILKISNN